MYVEGSKKINPNKILVLEDGLKIPNGGYVNTDSTASWGDSEYIVFDEKRVRIRYVVQIEN